MLYPHIGACNVIEIALKRYDTVAYGNAVLIVTSVQEVTFGGRFKPE